jgi:hypothetical protein
MYPFGQVDSICPPTLRIASPLVRVFGRCLLDFREACACQVKSMMTTNSWLSIVNHQKPSMKGKRRYDQFMSYILPCISHIQQDLQADVDDEHDILLDQSNEVDSFLPTSVSALELTISYAHLLLFRHISNLFNHPSDADAVLWYRNAIGPRSLT